MWSISVPRFCMYIIKVRARDGEDGGGIKYKMDKPQIIFQDDGNVEVHLPQKIVKLRGSTDSDCRRVYTESYETSSLTPEERKEVKKRLEESNCIVD